MPVGSALQTLRRVHMKTLRHWAELALTRAGLRETPKQRGQREMVTAALSLTGYSQVEGDYLEFGVFWGDSFINAWHAARTTGQSQMRFFAFDSFAGLPDPELSAPDVGGEFAKGDFACDRPTFEQNLRRAGVDLQRVVVVDGFYEETLRDNKPGDLGLEAAAVVWIDCDLYSSTVCVLDYITDLVRDGSILVFDDWHSFRSSSDKGEQKACAEWLERNPGITLTPYRSFHWSGQSFLVDLTDEPEG